MYRKEIKIERCVFYQCCAKRRPYPSGICEMEERPLYPAKEPLQPWQNPTHKHTQLLLIFDYNILLMDDNW